MRRPVQAGGWEREAGAAELAPEQHSTAGSGSTRGKGDRRPKPQPPPPPLGCKGRAAEQPPGPQSAQGKGRDSDVMIWAKPWWPGGCGL